MINLLTPLFAEVSDVDARKILEELRQERQAIEEIIISLERLALGRGKRRGRPAKWMKEAEKEPGRPPKKKAGSAA